MAKVTERYFDLIGSELDATRLKKLVRKDGRKIIRPIFLAKTSNVTPNEFKKIPQEFRCDYEWDSYTRTYYTDGTDVWAKEWRKHSPYWRNPNHPYYVKTSVTGSEIACAYEGSELQKKALALFYDGQTGSTFRSYAETVAKKQGLDMMRDDGSSDVFFAGHCEEASMRIRLEQAWKKRHPEDDVEVISDTGMYTSGYMNPDGSRKYAFAIINPDDAIKINGVVGIVEYKTCNFGSEKMQLWKNDIVPFEYYLQVAYYMAIKNVPYAVICVKFGISEEDFKYFVIHRDFDVEDEILKMAEELCKDVESGVEPSLDRGKAELLLQYYKKRFGSLKVKERNVLLDTSYIFDAEELIELHEKLESAKQAEKQYKSDIKEKTLAIAKAADGASTAYIPYGKTGKYVQVSLRSSVRKSSLVDVDKVYEKYPDLYERYVERNFNAAAFIKENPQLLEECKKDELVYSESTSDGVKMDEQGYVDKIFRNKEEGKIGKSKKK